MEVLYKKLYEKYNNLKVKRISQLDDANANLERRFQDYLSAADAYVDQLKGENEKLRTDIGDLRNEVASLSCSLSKDQKYEDIQKLLSEERQKNEELTKEVDNLLKLQQEGTSQNQETVTPQSTLTRKRRRVSRNASDTVSTEFVHSDVPHSNVLEPAPSLSQENIYHVDQLQCCRSPNDSGLCNCLFQDLSECLTGMKFSVDRQSDSVGLSALHQSSGYSFKLTWVKKPANEETEFLYQVSSLGTFERVAPEFMREAIVFSFRMCPMFFERVSRFIKHL